MGVALYIQELLRNSIQNWRTCLTAGSDTLGEVRIRRGIFQGDSLSPLIFVICLIPLTLLRRKAKGHFRLGGDSGSLNHLLFMDDLKLYGRDERELNSPVNTVRVFSTDTGMEIGLKKCGVLVMKRGKVVEFVGKDLPDGERMKTVSEDGYKYLGVLELDGVLNDEMKVKLKGKNIRRLKRC